MAREFEVPLILTSPHIRGDRVRDAQFLLSGHTRFDGLAPYKDGELDGEYGPKTAAATKSAKFWLGYPAASCDRVFGQTLYEYLRTKDWRPLPEEYRRRRSQRLAAANRKTPGLKALEVAIGQIGTTESPRGSNMNPYGKWYGFNGVPWCAIFESWCFAHSGRPSYRYAACVNIVSDARAGRNGLREVWSPMPGDVCVFNIHGDPFAHTSFFEKWINVGGAFYDVGGNTGPSNISNGGAVMRQRRDRSMVSHFVRVGG